MIDYSPIDQIAVDTACRQEWDVVIIGAGPAGATAGLHLARKGRRVLLIDQHNFPRDKVCGDALIPDALQCLRRSELYDLVDQHAYSVPTLRLYSPNRHMVDLPGEFKTIKRYELDYILVQGAVNKGAHFCKAKVRSVNPDIDNLARIELSDTENPVRAKVAIIATGADVALLKSLDVLSSTKLMPRPCAVL